MPVIAKASIGAKYTKEGVEKTKWTNIGVVNQNNKGNKTIILDPKVMSGFVQSAIIKDESLLISLFDPEDKPPF
tara:strand:- start:4206 stop:4427 length:222 start_codon:yes stop_codon:yes gene_type:complete